MAVLKYKNSQGKFVPIQFSTAKNNINVVLTTGLSKTDVMSQKAVTDILEDTVKQWVLNLGYSVLNINDLDIVYLHGRLNTNDNRIIIYTHKYTDLISSYLENNLSLNFKIILEDGTLCNVTLNNYSYNPNSVIQINGTNININSLISTNSIRLDVLDGSTEVFNEYTNSFEKKKYCEKLLLTTPLTVISDPDTIGEFPNQRVFDAISILCPVEITLELARSIFSNLNGTTKKVTIVYNGNLVLITSDTITIDGIVYNLGNCTIKQQDDLYYIHASGPNT